MTTSFNIQKKIEHTINVEVPSFWKRELTNRIVGILDTDSVYTILNIPGRYTSMSCGALDQGVAEDIQAMTPITEEEFFTEYNKAYEALRLKPEPRSEDDYTDSLVKILSSEKY